MAAIKSLFEFIQEIVNPRCAGPLFQLRHLHRDPGPAREAYEQLADQRCAAAFLVQL
jgi:hypothetical protein